MLKDHLGYQSNKSPSAALILEEELESGRIEDEEKDWEQLKGRAIVEKDS